MKLGQGFKSLAPRQPFVVCIPAQVYDLDNQVFSISDDEEVDEVSKRFRVGGTRSACANQRIVVAPVLR
jgi:hypothetical protein